MHLEPCDRDRELEALQQLIDEKAAQVNASEPTPIRSVVERAQKQVAKSQRTIRDEQWYREFEIQKRDELRAETWSRFVASRGPRYAECRLGNFQCQHEGQRAAVERLKAFARDLVAETRSGTNLLVFGPKGSGKDHLLSAMVFAAVRQDVYPRWVNGMDLFGEVRDLMDEGGSERRYVEALVAHQVLYISDPLPPSGPLSPFQQATLFRVLDGRYSRRKAVWCSVNVASSGELEDRIGAQNADRLRDGAIAIYCDWPSFRKVKG